MNEPLLITILKAAGALLGGICLGLWSIGLSEWFRQLWKRRK